VTGIGAKRPVEKAALGNDQRRQALPEIPRPQLGVDVQIVNVDVLWPKN
jgi:hypothetical protein